MDKKLGFLIKSAPFSIPYFSLVAYLAVFAYEFNFLSQFGVPPTFIHITLESLVILFGVFFIPFSFVVLIFPSEEDFVKNWTTLTAFFIFFINLFIAIRFKIFGVLGIPALTILFAGLFFAFLGINTSVVWLQKFSKRITNGKRWEFVVLFIFIPLGIINFAAMFGEIIPHTERLFSVLSDNNVIVRFYDDFLIAKHIEEDKLEDGYLLIPIDKMEQEITIKRLCLPRPEKGVCDIILSQ